MKNLRLLFFASFLGCFVPVLAYAQGVFIPPRTVFGTVNGITRPIAGATITVCAANTSGTPCSPALANTVFKDQALTVPLANPFTADSQGNYPQAALAGGTYTITESAPGFTGFSAQVTVTCAPGAPCTVSAFTASSATITGASTIGGGTTGAPTGTLAVGGGRPWIDITAPPWNAKCDGVTDDTAAFNSAISWTNSNSLAEIFVPATTTGCLINGALNLTNLKAGFKMGGASTTSRASTGPATSRLILANTAGSGIGLDLTGSFDMSFSYLNFVAPASSGAVIGIFCARNVGGTGPQKLSLEHISVILNGTGSSTHPSIAFYNAGCELNEYTDIYLEADLPLYGTAANPTSATFTATSPFLTTSGGTSTSGITCNSCTLVNDSSLVPALVLENTFDWKFNAFYATCKGASPGAQYAMSLTNVQNLFLHGRQEVCGLAAHAIGSMLNSTIKLTHAPIGGLTNHYMDIDGTLSATALPFNGNDIEIFDNQNRTGAFVAYNWLTNSSGIADNLFDVRSAGCDGTISSKASGNVGGNILRGSSGGACGDSSMSSTGTFNSYMLLTPDVTSFNGNVNVPLGTVTTLGLKTSVFQTGSNCQLGGAAGTTSPAACGSAMAGMIAIPASQTSYVVNTSGVTANSEIWVQQITDNSGLPSSPTCNSGATTPIQSARTANTSFTITLTSVASVTCFKYLIVN